MDPDGWAAMESDVQQQQQQQQQQQLSPPPALSPLLTPSSLQTVLLAQLTAQHASQLQYQQALLTWARLVTSGLPPPPPPLLSDPGAPGPRTGPLPGGGSPPSASSGSPPRSDGSPPGRPGRKPSGRAPKVFTCLVCGRSFGYKHVLQNHVRTHTGEKPFQCSVCCKRFTRDHHLKTHMRLHTGEKPYQCVHCARRFVQVANLRRHLRVHTGERPHACRQCTARFSDSSQLRTHELVHVGQKLFGCAVCGVEFRRRPQLVQHQCRVPPVGTVPTAAGEAPRHRRKTTEARRLVRPVPALTGGTAEPEAELKVKVELELDPAPGPVIGQAFSLASGLDAAQGQGQGLLPAEFSQTEPEDLSVTAFRWSSGSLDDQRPSSAALQSLAEFTGDDRDTEKTTPRLRWPPSPAEHGRGDAVGADPPRREQNIGASVPWWALRDLHSSKSAPEESRKPPVSPRDAAVSPWPLYPGHQEQQVLVFPEKQRISVRGLDQLAREASGLPGEASDRADGVRRRQEEQESLSATGRSWRQEEQEPLSATGRPWPWALSLADARRCLPEKEQGGGRPEASVSPDDVLVIDCESSDEEEAVQRGSPSTPRRSRSWAEEPDRSESEGNGMASAGRRALPLLVPLWIPPLTSAQPPPREDHRRTAEDAGSALLQLLTHPVSPRSAEQPWSRRRPDSGASDHCGDTEGDRHRQQRNEQHRGQEVTGGYSWDKKEDKHHWEDRGGKYHRRDTVEIQLL